MKNDGKFQSPIEPKKAQPNIDPNIECTPLIEKSKLLANTLPVHKKSPSSAEVDIPEYKTNSISIIRKYYKLT